MIRLIVFTVIIFAHSTFAQWRQTNGPNGGIITCMEMIEGNIFVGTWGNGIFLSSDNGGVWRSINSGLPNSSFQSHEIYTHAFILASQGRRIFTAIEHHGIYYSGDLGENWEARNEGLPTGQHIVTTTLYVDSQHLYAGINSKDVYRSNDSGLSWELLPASENLGVLTIAGYEESILIGTEKKGIYKSTDNGNSWNQLSSSTSILNINSIHEFEDCLFVGTETSGILWSLDGGYTWETLNDGIPSYIYQDNFFNTYEYYSSIKKIVPDDGVLLAILDEGLYFFSVIEQIWLPYIPTVPESGVSSFLRAENQIFVGTEKGVLRLSETDNDWTFVNNGIANIGVVSLSTNDDLLYAGTGLGLAFTSDDGNLWSNFDIKENSNDEFCSVTSIGSKIIAGTNNGHIYLSYDKGINWEEVNAGLPGNMERISCTLIDENLFFIGTYMRGVYSLQEYDTTWISRNVGFPISNNDPTKVDLYIRSLAINEGILFAGTDTGIYSSYDNGISWQKLSNLSSFFIPLNDTTLYRDWFADYVVRITEVNNKLFAGTLGGGIFVTDDRGVTWKHASKGLPYSVESQAYYGIQALISHDNNLFASIDQNGMFCSTDYGENWNAANEGLETVTAYALASNDDYLFLGAFHVGVWRRPLFEMITSINSNNEVPQVYRLFQNYPNPFNPATKISYSINQTGHVTIVVYDLLGRMVSKIVDEQKSIGNHMIEFDGAYLPSGIYFYQLELDGYSETKKMTLIK